MQKPIESKLKTTKEKLSNLKNAEEFEKNVCQQAHEAQIRKIEHMKSLPTGKITKLGEIPFKSDIRPGRLSLISTKGIKYHRTIRSLDGTKNCLIDVYCVAEAYELPADSFQAVKKILAPGKRGVKNEVTDLKEAIVALEARIKRIS